VKQGNTPTRRTARGVENPATQSPNATSPPPKTEPPSHGLHGRWQLDKSVAANQRTKPSLPLRKFKKSQQLKRWTKISLKPRYAGRLAKKKFFRRAASAARKVLPHGLWEFLETEILGGTKFGSPEGTQKTKETSQRHVPSTHHDITLGKTPTTSQSSPRHRLLGTPNQQING